MVNDSELQVKERSGKGDWKRRLCKKNEKICWKARSAWNTTI